MWMPLHNTCNYDTTLEKRGKEHCMIFGMEMVKDVENGREYQTLQDQIFVT
jgi:hypothetical protein